MKGHELFWRNLVTASLKHATAVQQMATEVLRLHDAFSLTLQSPHLSALMCPLLQMTFKVNMLMMICRAAQCSLCWRAFLFTCNGEGQL